MNVLDLFSGIGGFSLGLERAGMRTVAFCEIDPYCREVLRKHWPFVPIFHDVRTLTGAAVGNVDVICGGFPCQDISVAGRGAGIDGTQSGLWREFARVVGEIRPRYVLVENVAALLARGLSKVLGDLSEIGYDAEWHVVSAADVGAPHQRERVWIIAYPMRDELRQQSGRRGRQSRPSEVFAAEHGEASDVADAESSRLEGHWTHAGQSPLAESRDYRAPIRIAVERSDWWQVEPDVGRVAHGVPARVDRITALGNALVPQIAQMIGSAIMQAHA